MLFLRILVCLLLAGFGRGNSPAQEPFDPTGYRHNARLVVVGLEGDEVLTDFPLLVKFSTNLPGFGYSQVRSPTAADLRFVDEWGNELPSQIEVWNPAGDSWVWIRTPVLSNGLTLRAWWGADGVSEPSYRRNGTTFAGPGFAAVWHMETNYIRDATGNGYHARRIPLPAAVQTVPGVVGPAQRFNGRVGNNNRIVVGPALRVPAAFTVSAWVWLEDEIRDGVILAKLGRMFLWQHGDTFRFETAPWGGDTRFPINSAGGLRRWIHLAAVQNGLRAELYVDGSRVATWQKSSLPAMGSEEFCVGGGWDRLFHGILDECRVESVPRSAAWIRACYRNQREPEAFVAFVPGANRLHIVRTETGALQLRWLARNDRLERTDNLGPDPAWTTGDLPEPVREGETNHVTIQPAQPRQFFRLNVSLPGFSVDLPAGELVVTQGLATTRWLSLHPEEGFAAWIRLELTNLPPGVSAELHPSTLKTGRCLLTLQADPDAKPGRFEMRLRVRGGLQQRELPLRVQVVADPPDAPYTWPAYDPDLNYHFATEYPDLPAPTNVLDDCAGVTTTITLPGNWFCFRFGPDKHPLVTSNAWIPMLRRLHEEFVYYREVMGWPPDKRAKRGYYSSVYLYGSGTCVGGRPDDTGGWMGSITHNHESWPMILLSYYPVYSFDPACPYPDRFWQQDAVIHEAIHAILADMPGCKQAAWFHEGGNTWLQSEATARRTGNYSSMGWLSAGAMIAPFMPIECYSGWLQDDSFGGPSAEGVNLYSNGVQICTWRNLLGGTQYGECFARFLGEIVSPGAVAWIWRHCTNRVLEGLATAPHGLGPTQTRRLIREFRARQVFCDFGRWSAAFRRLLDDNWGRTIRAEWEPFWIDTPPWTARCYVVTTNLNGTLVPEWRTLPGWSGANQIPLLTSNATGTVRILFTPLGSNLTCQLVYRATDGSVVYSKPVGSGPVSLTPPPGKPIRNNVVVAVVVNSDYRYLGEFSRTNKFDYRLTIAGPGTAGVVRPADIATRWYR